MFKKTKALIKRIEQLEQRVRAIEERHEQEYDLTHPPVMGGRKKV